MPLICFDLEGTLVDPLEGTVESLRRACGELGLPCPARERIAACIGLDLGGLFENLPVFRIQEVLERFARIFEEEGIYRQHVLDGVQPMLARLKRQGHRLALAAGQPAAQARRTLHQFDLLLHFEAVAGGAPTGPWRSKAEVLERLRLDGYLRSGGCLIGDRADDIRAAKALGLTSLGVTYGFGSHQELAAAQADHLLHSVQELDARLEKDFKGPEIHDPFSRSE